MEAGVERGMEELRGELRRVVSAAEALLEAGGDRLDDTREALAERVRDARLRLRDLEHEVAYRTRRTARDVDRYAHEHPWQVAGIGVALATAAALAAWLLLDSRRD